MKTSNIILTAIFASILVWILVAFFTVKAKLSDFVGDNNTIEVFSGDKENDETLKLENFSGISVEGTGWVSLTQSSENKLSHYIKDDCEVEVRDNVLHIKINNTKNGVVIHASNVNKILTQEKISLTIYDVKTDTLKVNTKDKSELNVKGLSANFLKLKSENNSKVHLHNVNETVPEAEFELKDKSTVTINNTRGMSISVKKGADAKYKDY